MKFICLVDDDKIYQTIVLKQLAKIADDCRIVALDDGEEAIGAIKKMIMDKADLPDLILLDLNMPFMDGWDFLNEFKMLKGYTSKKINIVIVTSSVDERDLSRAREYEEVSGYMVKPVIMTDLKKVVASLMSSN